MHIVYIPDAGSDKNVGVRHTNAFLVFAHIYV